MVMYGCMARARGAGGGGGGGGGECLPPTPQKINLKNEAKFLWS